MSKDLWFPMICPFCGEMVKDVMDYLDNHLSKHCPVAYSQFCKAGGDAEK